MVIGVPEEIKNNEKRVALTPYGANELIQLGHTVYIQENAGIGSGFSSLDYKNAGVNISPNVEDIYALSDLIVKVKEPQPEEVKMLDSKHILFTFFHFAADKKLTKACLNSGATCIAYETVQNEDGTLPILVPMSEVAGRMAIQNGAKCLEGSVGGKGILLGGVPGVDASTVTIIGGGIVGMNAAKIAAGLGAKVYILDINSSRLKYLDDIMPSNVQTIYSSKHNILTLLELLGSI